MWLRGRVSTTGEIAGSLVTGQLTLSMGDRVVEGKGLAFVEDDDGFDDLAPLEVGRADHGGLSDGRVTLQHLLDLTGRDILGRRG